MTRWLSWFLLMVTWQVWAVDYSLPNGPLPSGCKRASSTVTCPALSLSWNDSISVSSTSNSITLKINGKASFSNAKVNQSGSASRLTIEVAGNLTSGSDFRANANITVAKAADFGYANKVVGNISAQTIQTSSSSSFSGDMNATSIDTASDNQITGNLTASIIELGSSNTLVGGLYGGTIVTGSANKITGPIQGADVTISSSSSRIEGDIYASDELLIGSGTTVIGDLTAYRIDTVSAVYLSGEVTSTTSFTLASGSSLTGNVVAPVVDIKPSNAAVYGDILASTSLTIGSSGNVYGNIETGQAILKSSNALVDGNIVADSLVVVDWGGRVTGDVTASHITNNGTIDGGVYCDSSDGYTPTSCSSPAAQVHHFLLSHNGLMATCESQYPVNVIACGDAACTTQAEITATVEVAEKDGKLASVVASFNNSSQANVVMVIDPQALYPATFELSTGAISGTIPSNTLACVKGQTGQACQFTVKDSLLRFVRKNTSDTALSHQVAGVAFELDVQAITTDAETGFCNAALTNNQALSIDLGCQDPGTCSSGNWLTVNNVSLGDAPGTIQADFGNTGQATLNVRFDDAGKITLAAATTSNNSSKQLSGTSSSFAVKPAAVAIEVKNASGNSSSFSGAYHEGGVFAKAGEAFSVKLSALNALGGTTNNFGNEAAPRKLVIVGHELLAPTPGESGNLTNQAAFTKVNTTSGVFENLNVSFSEVGVIRVSVDVDQDYLGAGKILPLSQSEPIGRFVPAYFALTDDSITPACGLVGETPAPFTYMGQGFGLTANIVAKNTAGTTTQNYMGPFAKSANLALMAYEGEVLSDRLLPNELDTLWDKGIAGIDANIVFSRGTSADGPYDALLLGISINDSDMVAMQNVHTDLSPAQNIASGSPMKIRYGRATLFNTFGPETENLPLPLVVQYFDRASNQWLTNELDNCSVFNAGELSILSKTPSGILTTPAGSGTVLSGQPLLPSAGFILSPTNMQGEISLQWQTPFSWLLFDWQNSGIQEGPKAKASFGQFRGNDRLIFQREVFP